ncbi:MAG: hypothetical protein KAS32_24935 [Candidatus Peribacteraceae bacterium]|nr:hypothetical protein [Candidatus Peribacteraceae bacterium]
MDGFTKEQKTQLKTWAEQRDELLLEIQILRTSKEQLEISNKELAASSSDIESRMLVIRGRIEELKIKESELPQVISKEVAFLESKKSTLESQIPLLEKLIKSLSLRKSDLESDIEHTLFSFSTIRDEALLLDKVVDRVTLVSKGNTEKIDSLVSNLATSLEEIIDVNKKNVSETNVVLDKLPTMLMELQKRGLIKPRQAIIKNKV